MKNPMQKNSQVISVLLKWSGAVLLCFAVSYFYEAYPRFITLSISLPSDNYASQIWTFPTYSVIRARQSRYFSWKEFSILSYEGFSETESRRAIFDHFDEQLLKQGWARSTFNTNSYTNCYDEKIFPEAFFLRPTQDFSEDGFVTYKRKKDFSLISSKVSDEICLAIWRRWDNETSVFNIVIFTIKPSPLTWLSYHN